MLGSVMGLCLQLIIQLTADCIDRQYLNQIGGDVLVLVSLPLGGPPRRLSQMFCPTNRSNGRRTISYMFRTRVESVEKRLEISHSVIVLRMM